MLVQEHHQRAAWKISLYAKRWSHLPSISQAQGELWPAGTFIYELDHHFNITTPWCQNPGQRTFNKSYITDPSFQTLNSKSMPITSLQVIRSLSWVGGQVQPLLGAGCQISPKMQCVFLSISFFSFQFLVCDFPSWLDIRFKHGAARGQRSFWNWLLIIISRLPA